MNRSDNQQDSISGPAADLIVTDARVWTGDETSPEAEAVAILGDRIVAAGSAAEVALWRGKRTRVIPAQGRLLLPGFNDAHLHLVDGGLQLDNVDLREAASPGEFADRIGAHVRTIGAGEWVLGGGWDEQRWDRHELPTRQMIDPVTPDTPVLIERYDMHMALANTVALRLAGVTAATPTPRGGEIVRDSRGNPTGILKDAAIRCVAAFVPPTTPARRLRAVKRALEHAAALGVTSVQHMGPASDDLALYMELAERGELTTRIYVAQPNLEWAERGRVAIRHGFGSSVLRLGALKGFADGSLGSATAYFFQPYANADTCGLLSDEMQDRETLRERLLQADKAAMQVCWHAIGDQAVSLTLDLFKEIERFHGPRDRRLRIEHAQHVTARDFDRFSRLRVIASVQPYHAIDDGRWAEQRVGAQRLKTSYPYRSFLDHGVRLALGTDWCVAPLNPLLTLYAATTRATLDGKNPQGWIPEQKLSMSEAVAAYTSGSAFAEFHEKEKGSISRGKLADMVLLSDNIFKIDPGQVRDVRVLLTIMGGKIVYSSAGWTAPALK
jgi:predicted amidohydrolase YtcJ